MLLLGFCAATSAAWAQPVPLPAVIRLVVPFGPGSTTDVVARKTAAQLATRLGNTVVVENRAGGSTLIGSGAVVNGPKDGSLLLVTTNSTVSAAATVKTMPFNFSRDLVPIAMLSEGPILVAASAKSGFKSPADLVAAARAQPDRVTYGTSGNGSLPHLSTEAFASAAGIKLRHIPYKGGAFALVDLGSGVIDLQFGTYATFAAQIKAGRVVPIAVTSEKPSAAFPDLPVMASVAPGFKDAVWISVFAPAGLPAALAQRLNRELNEISASKELREVQESDGSAPVALALEPLRLRMLAEVTAWQKLAAEKKIVVD